jgi:hypothetical protein
MLNNRDPEYFAFFGSTFKVIALIFVCFLSGLLESGDCLGP